MFSIANFSRSSNFSFFMLLKHLRTILNLLNPCFNCRTEASAFTTKSTSKISPPYCPLTISPMIPPSLNLLPFSQSSSSPPLSPSPLVYNHLRVPHNVVMSLAWLESRTMRGDSIWLTSSFIRPSRHSCALPKSQVPFLFPNPLPPLSQLHHHRHCNPFPYTVVSNCLH